MNKRFYYDDNKERTIRNIRRQFITSVSKHKIILVTIPFEGKNIEKAAAHWVQASNR